jgi:hypothetical protein
LARSLSQSVESEYNGLVGGQRAALLPGFRKSSFVELGVDGGERLRADPCEPRGRAPISSMRAVELENLRPGCGSSREGQHARETTDAGCDQEKIR